MFHIEAVPVSIDFNDGPEIYEVIKEALKDRDIGILSKYHLLK